MQSLADEPVSLPRKVYPTGDYRPIRIICCFGACGEIDVTPPLVQRSREILSTLLCEEIPMASKSQYCIFSSG